MYNEVKTDSFDKRVYLATTLSAFTGMRQGEIRALHKDAILLVNEEQGIITVSQAIAVYAGLKTTKGKRDRQVPAPRWLCEELLEMERLNPYGNGLIFWSSTAKTNPIAASHLRKSFYSALDAIGVTEEDRKKRNISYHSLRHYYVTFMRGRVADNLLQAIVGHQSSEMSDLYTHGTMEKLLEVGKVSNKIVNFPQPREALN